MRKSTSLVGILLCIALSVPLSGFAESHRAQQNPANDGFMAITQTRHGKQVAAKIAQEYGILFDQVKATEGVSPLDEASTDVVVTLTKRSRPSSRGGVNLNPHEGVLAGPPSVGDTQTYTWEEDGWRYSMTLTYDGSNWQLTAFSAVKL